MNIYMVLLIFIISGRFFIYGIINIICDFYTIAIYTKYFNLSSVVIPICYLYFKNLDSKKNYSRTDWLHLIFPIFYFFITLKIYDFISPSYSIRLLLYLIFLAFLITYIYLCFNVLKNNIWNKKKQNKKIHNWTLFLFSALLLAALRLSVSLLLEVSHNGIMRGLSYQWVASLIWIFILIKILISPEILYGYTLLNEKIQENRNSKLVFNEIWKTQPITEIKNSQHLVLKEKINPNLQNYFEEIEKISFQHDFFRDQNATVSDLAIKLSIPKSHLSYLFKYHATISFSEYKKAIRIQDAIQLIDNGYLKNNTLDSLSKKIGFTSYNPFFTSFKEITGNAPIEYVNSIHSPI